MACILSPITPTVAASAQALAQPEGKVGSRRHLLFVPRNLIINVVMYIYGASVYSPTVDVTVRFRAIFEFINTQAQGGIAGAMLTIPWKNGA
ncbi:hypothetical protein BGY98DRAFT_1097662 [Russula aff. rugulosa BPL654]|nr:hypothetical protein BGY98DRAFT_1097662 [Russula aff. rugulosa BPL654]